jgi:cytochrome c peroxidase
VEPRNTPTTVNAVFNHRNFWDGRANNIFNGVSPLGPRDTAAKVWKAAPDGAVTQVAVRIDNASLASQAVGPPLSEFEMSCAGRTFPDVGRKMLQLQPLAKQRISPSDSVLAPFRAANGKGLSTSYERLIKKAFKGKWWKAPGTVDGNFTQMEANFSLFWGLAIQLYEATLVADDTAFDRFAAGHNDALTEEEKLGLEMFLTKGRCINCHAGPEFTGASVRLRACPPFGDQEAIERMLMGDGNAAVYDGGFYNIGVRPTFEDLAVGADLAGFPLSFARQEVVGPKVDELCFNQAGFEIPGPIVPGERVAVDGAFKVPTIRNVELTAPYFHSGGHSTLEQVVEFYDRGGDFHDLNIDNLDPDIEPIGFAPDEETGLVAFMKALTDRRVNLERAPFDHPNLPIPNGQKGDEIQVEPGDGLNAQDDIDIIRRVGLFGRGNKLPPLSEVGFATKLAPGPAN